MAIERPQELPVLPSDRDIAALLAPTGVLRAGINLSNFLLVSSRAANGDPVGVAPDMARAVADRLGIPVRYVPYPKPSELADAVGADAWDIGLIGAEPARAEVIDFTQAYCEIQSTYLVPPGSTLHAIADIDRPGIRIAVAARTAYGLWLDRNIHHATIVHAEGLDASFDLFVRDKLDALAGLRPKLLSEVERLPGARILESQFAAVQQAIGTPRGRDPKAAAFLQTFVADAIASGLVARLIDQHHVQGLSVAGATP